MTSKIIYNESLLKNAINTSNAILIGTYENLNRDININFICKCGKESIKTFRSIYNIGAICRKCTSLSQIDKKRITEIKLYGVDNAMKLPEFKEKLKQSIIKKYGVEYALQNKEIMNKLQKTVLERYGVEHVLQVEKYKEKVVDTTFKRYGVKSIFQLEETKEKIKQKMIEKYGVEHNLQASEIKIKIQQTYIKKYNTEYYLKTKEFKEKSKISCLKKYGVDNPNKVSEIREKIKQTCLERYGVEHPNQCKEIMDKTQKNAKKYKEYTMPSGIIRKVQGYESFALDELVKIYSENDIKTDRKDIPRIKYILNDKNKYYFPDIYIKSENKIIEVKSNWTYKCKEDNIQEKSNATKLAGYEYEIWIYDNKGNKTILT